MIVGVTHLYIVIGVCFFVLGFFALPHLDSADHSVRVLSREVDFGVLYVDLV